MAKAEIAVELTRPGATRLGEHLSGRFRVRARESLNCQGIDLSIGYRICRTASNLPDEVPVYHMEGEAIRLLPGSEYEKEFDVPLPDGPMSFQGECFSIVWFVAVEIRLPWAIDVREERNFKVLPARPGVLRSSAASPDEVPIGVSSPKRRFGLASFGLLLMGLGLAVVFYYLSPTIFHDQKPQEADLIRTFVGVLMVFFGLIITSIGVLIRVSKALQGHG